MPSAGNELLFNLIITIMKKLFLLLTAAICVASSAFAQTPIKYQGEVDLGYSLGVGEFATGRVNIQTIHGAMIGQYFSAGIGLGVDIYHEGGTDVVVPIFLNLKGYLPTNSKITPYASFDIGAGIGVSEYVSGLSGVMLTPAIGIKAGMFKAQLGFNVQKFSESGISIGFNAVQLKVGVVF